MGAPQAFTLPALEFHAWFHGFTFNATPGSRTAFSSAATDTIKNGHVFCFDPEAYEDRASLPTGMLLGKRLSSNSLASPEDVPVTKPATGILGLFAGVVVDLPPEGLRPDKEYGNGGYKGGVRLKLRCSGPAIANMVGDCTSTGYETLLAPTNGSWALGILAVGTNGANLPFICARPRHQDNVAAAATKRVFLGAMGRPVAA
jgi:hypothetical protein